MRGLGFVLALLGLALSWGGCATPVYQLPWLEVRTAHLELSASLPESRAVELARDLELLRSVVEVLTQAEIPKLPVPLRVFLVPDEAAYRALGPRHTAGFFLPTMRDGNIVALAHPGYMSSALRTLQHEYVHWLIENRDAYPYPTWYNEGFAQFLSTVAHDGNVVKIGRAPVERMRVFDSGAWLDLERLLSTRGLAGWRMADVHAFYAQSWALVHYLNFGQPEGRAMRRQMARYLRLVRRGEATREAVSQGFGVTIEKLDEELRAYVKAAQFRYVDADAAKFPFDPTTRVRALPREAVATQLGWLFVAREQDDEAQHAFEAALRVASDHARAHAGLGAVESSRQRWEQAEGHHLRAVELAPDDPLNLLDLAEHYHERAQRSTDPETRTRLAEQARAHYRRSIALDGRLPETQAMYGATWSLPGEDEQRRGDGLANLERAHQELPGNGEIKFLLARRYADLGRYEPARVLAVDALAGAHHTETRSEIEALIEEIDASTSP